MWTDLHKITKGPHSHFVQGVKFLCGLTSPCDILQMKTLCSYGCISIPADAWVSLVTCSFSMFMIWSLCNTEYSLLILRNFPFWASTLRIGWFLAEPSSVLYNCPLRFCEYSSPMYVTITSPKIQENGKTNKCRIKITNKAALYKFTLPIEYMV